MTLRKNNRQELFSKQKERRKKIIVFDKKYLRLLKWNALVSYFMWFNIVRVCLLTIYYAFQWFFILYLLLSSLNYPSGNHKVNLKVSNCPLVSFLFVYFSLYFSARLCSVYLFLFYFFATLISMNWLLLRKMRESWWNVLNLLCMLIENKLKQKFHDSNLETHLKKAFFWFKWLYEYTYYVLLTALTIYRVVLW